MIQIIGNTDRTGGRENIQDEYYAGKRDDDADDLFFRQHVDEDNPLELDV